MTTEGDQYVKTMLREVDRMLAEAKSAEDVAEVTKEIRSFERREKTVIQRYEERVAAARRKLKYLEGELAVEVELLKEVKDRERTVLAEVADRVLNAGERAEAERVARILKEG